MFNRESTRHIDLHLPTGWNRCTTEELEAIAAAIIQEQQRVDRYHPFDWQRVKLSVVLSINEITVMEDGRGKRDDVRGKKDDVRGKKEEGRDISPQPSAISHQPSDIESTWLVRRPDDKEPWPISVGQLLAITDMLSWLDDEKSDKTVFLFPYPEIDVRCKKEEGRALSQLPLTRLPVAFQPSSIIHLQGPPPLLDGYTWKEYRWLTDWMQEYMRCANAMSDGRGKREDVRRKNQAALDSAQREFLAVLFRPCEKSQGVGAAEDTSDISHLTSDIFTDFDAVKWQVILFWWSSLMGMLAKKFPRVFKPQAVGKKQRPQKADTPWDFYNRVTATIQKYVGGLSSQDVDNQPYGVTLQQLEMMADEAAEMEKLKRKK